MANGMDWFRWHHGSVTDPKFKLIAHKSDQTVAVVIAVWACLLEAASQAQKRGQLEGFDPESTDCLLGMPDGTTSQVLAAMSKRGLIFDACISSWEKRQPKRERSGDHSTARVQKHRESILELEQCNAKEHHETPRGEESRKEDIKKEIHFRPTFPHERVAGDSPNSAGFDAFWAVYPRREGKYGASKAFEKALWVLARPDAAERIRDAALAYSKASADKDKEFIALPTRWLNEGRWEDQLPTCPSLLISSESNSFKGLNRV
jgi:hypothetical protein